MDPGRGVADDEAAKLHVAPPEVPRDRRLRDVNGCRPEFQVTIRSAQHQRADHAARELAFNRAAKQKVRLAGEGAGSAKGPRTRPAESTCAERPVDQPRALLTIDGRIPAEAAILLNAGGC